MLLLTFVWYHYGVLHFVELGLKRHSILVFCVFKQHKDNKEDNVVIDLGYCYDYYLHLLL